MAEQIVLATKTIPSENTPEKEATDRLRIHPVWNYRGPACTINFEWSVGQWKWGTYDRITDEYASAINQVASENWQEFEPAVALPSIPLDKLSPRDEPYVAEMWFRGPFADLCVRVEDCVKIVGVAPPPPLEPPDVETLDAEDITQTSATLYGRLIDTSYWSNVDVYFEFGKTTSYEMGSTKKYRMYSGDEGEKFKVGITGLKGDTRYHFRAVVEAVGARSEEVGPGYGADKSFTTEEVGTLEVYRTRFFYNGHFYDSPKVIHIGDEVGVQFNYRNVSGKTLSVRASLVIYSWGYSAGRIGTDWEGSMSPDKTRAIHLTFVADEISEWTARLILEADGEEVLDTTVVIGYCPPV